MVQGLEQLLLEFWLSFILYVGHQFVFFLLLMLLGRIK